MSLIEANDAFRELGEWAVSTEAGDLPLHVVERRVEAEGREALRKVLQAHINSRGPGDVGPAPGVRVLDDEGGVRTCAERREAPRNVQSIFGEVVANRLAYIAPGLQAVHPLDEKLELPAQSFSNEVQRRAARAAVQGPFSEAAERLREETGLPIPKRSVEQIVRGGAEDFDGFYDQRVPADAATTGSILVGGVDGKGVPMVKADRPKPRPGRKKGKKAKKRPGVKRMATVASVHTQAPRPRTPEEVVDSLFRTGPVALDGPNPQRERSKPEHRRVWASLFKPKEAVIADMAAEMGRRDPEHNKTHVVLTDGERALQLRVRAVVPDALLILDIIHVLGYLWRVANVLHGEAEGSGEASDWVRTHVLWILQGRVSQVVKGMRQSATKRRLSGTKAKIVQGAALYLYRNRHSMRYHDYLAAGLPIASGAVEGACKNLVKDRMERSGMFWTKATAEALLKLRAAYVSGDFDEYWAYHVKSEQSRLHPPTRWSTATRSVAK